MTEKHISDMTIRAYLDGDQIHYIYDAPFGRLTTQGRLGKNLADFVWLDEALVFDIFDLLHLKAIEKHGNPDLPGVLIAFTKNFVESNSYLALFLTMAMTWLTDPKERPDSPLNADKLARMRREMLSLQELIEKDLALLFADDKRLAGLDPAQKLYVLAKSDEFAFDFRNIEFRSSLSSDYDLSEVEPKLLPRTIRGKNVRFVEMYGFETVEDLLRFEMVHMALAGVSPKRCEHCGKLFIPKGRKDVIYCDRKAPGEDEPCSKIGAQRKRDKQVKESPAWSAYTAALKRMSKRKMRGVLKEKAFQRWNLEATIKRDDVVDGKLAEADYIAWLDETSRADGHHSSGKSSS